jgi:hypothetical protein
VATTQNGTTDADAPESAEHEANDSTEDRDAA